MLPLLEGSKSSLKSLYLDSNSIEDEGANLLVRLGAKNLSLSTLTLRGNRSITIEKWSAFASLLHPSSSSSKLNVLKLGATDHGSDNDEYVVAFAEALANSTNMEVLGLLGRLGETRYIENENFFVTHVFHPGEISTNGWNAIATALCDNSSIASVCSSNHTLYELLDSEDKRYSCHHRCIPSLVQKFLDMNREKNKADVVRSKILKFFFTDVDSVERTFADAGTTMMPDAIGFIGRDRLGFSTMYLLLRSMPWLFNSVASHVPCSEEPPAKLQKLE